MKSFLPIVTIAYLLGSIPFGYLLVRIFRKQDIRATGSGNIGATNVARSGAKGLGIATLLLDCLKAVVAVLLAKHFATPAMAADLPAAAGVATILGHVFPVWLGFKGGKGVASALGVFLALCWPAALGALGAFLLVAVATRYISLASVVGAAALPVFVFLFDATRTPLFVASVLFIPLLVVLKHGSNLSRLRAGTETKFGSKKVTA